MADVATSEILLSELSTKTVTLMLERATVVREIKTKIQVSNHTLVLWTTDR